MLCRPAVEAGSSDQPALLSAELSSREDIPASRGSNHAHPLSRCRDPCACVGECELEKKLLVEYTHRFAEVRRKVLPLLDVDAISIAPSAAGPCFAAMNPTSGAPLLIRAVEMRWDKLICGSTFQDPHSVRAGALGWAGWAGGCERGCFCLHGHDELNHNNKTSTNGSTPANPVHTQRRKHPNITELYRPSTPNTVSAHLTSSTYSKSSQIERYEFRSFASCVALGDLVKPPPRTSRNPGLWSFRVTTASGRPDGVHPEKSLSKASEGRGGPR